jgi:6-phosphogluconolactonase
MKYKKNVFQARSEMLDRLALALGQIIYDTLKKQDIFRLVLGGGRTQEELNARIVGLKNPFPDWQRVLIYLSDERCVPSDHEQSNYHLNVSTLVVPLKMPRGNIHGIRTDLDPDKAAFEYSGLLRKTAGSCQGTMFDLALLGLGPDGHTASLFPGSPALEESENLAAASGPGPEGLSRITMTYPALNASRLIWIMAAGTGKIEPVSRLLNGSYNPGTCPAQGVRPDSREITLWLDTEAGGD